MRLLTLIASVALSAALAVVSTPAAARAETLPTPAHHAVWPLSPRPGIVRGFDPPDSPYGVGHRGVDLLGRAGQPVHTALAGTVTFASVLAGRGVVVVDHGDVRTTYEPVTASVHVGDHVARGAVIGTLQRAGSHCFPRACLHWGLRRGAHYLDPLLLVGAGPVRLLPLEGGVALGARPATGGAPDMGAVPAGSEGLDGQPVRVRLPPPRAV